MPKIRLHRRNASAPWRTWAVDDDGCAPCEARAREAEMAAEARAAGEEQPLPTGWSGVLVVEGAMTGDGRMIEREALTWADLPIPLRWAASDVGGHDGAVVVGRIESIERDGQSIAATGSFDLGSNEGREAARQVRDGLTPGVSVDLDDIAFEIRVAGDILDALDDEIEADVELRDAERDEDGRVVVATIRTDDEVMVTTEGRIRAATLVATPAFVEARIEPVYDDSLVASVLGTIPDMPVASLDHEWDGRAAGQRVAEFCRDDEGVGRSCMARAFLFMDAGDDPSNRSAYKLGYADVIDDELTIVPAGVFAIASVLSGGRGGVDVPEDDMPGLRTATCRLYDRIAAVHDDAPECPFGEGEEEPAGAAENSLAAGASIKRPPLAYFENPLLSEPTGIKITEGGRIYGHLATWGVCHTGFPNECVTAPTSVANYAYFRTGSILTDEGNEVAVGRITMDTMHAGQRLGAAATLSHYEHTGVAVADVAAGEDSHGIWISGYVRPSVDEQTRQVIRSSPLSGDWRRIGGSLELVAALAVNSPGFPVTRALVASGEVQTLHLSTRKDAEGEALTPEDMEMLRHAVERERKRTEKVDAAKAEANRKVLVAAAASKVYAASKKGVTR